MSKKSWAVLLIIAFISLLILIYFKFFKKKGKGLSIFNKANCNSRFLFVGDSLTEFNSSYADQLNQYCPTISIKKISQVGAKTDWMLSQLTNELSTNSYDVITVWGGLNDIYATNSIVNTENNLSQMYSLAKQNGAKVVGITIPPTNTYSSSSSITESLTIDLNNWILNNNSLDAVIDANSLLNDGNNATQAQYLQPDFLHTNSDGHFLISQDFYNKIIK